MFVLWNFNIVLGTILVQNKIVLYPLKSCYRRKRTAERQTENCNPGVKVSGRTRESARENGRIRGGLKQFTSQNTIVLYASPVQILSVVTTLLLLLLFTVYIYIYSRISGNYVYTKRIYTLFVLYTSVGVQKRKKRNCEINIIILCYVLCRDVLL